MYVFIYLHITNVSQEDYFLRGRFHIPSGGLQLGEATRRRSVCGRIYIQPRHDNKSTAIVVVIWMDYKFSNLLGAPYRGGALLLHGNTLITPVGNRIGQVCFRRQSRCDFRFKKICYIINNEIRVLIFNIPFLLCTVDNHVLTGKGLRAKC